MTDENQLNLQELVDIKQINIENLPLEFLEIVKDSYIKENEEIPIKLNEIINNKKINYKKESKNKALKRILFLSFISSLTKNVQINNLIYGEENE